jgi:hypothetical protein
MIDIGECGEFNEATEKIFGGWSTIFFSLALQPPSALASYSVS